MPDNTPTNANAPAPASGEGTPAPGQMFTAEQYHGLRGNLEHQRDQFKAQAEAALKKVAEFEAQFKATSDQLAEFSKKAVVADELAKKLAETETAAKAQQSLNGRLQSLMKFPSLQSEETIELVKSTSLEGEALEKVLAGLAAKLGAQPALGSGAGATPQTPPKSEITPHDIMQEALAEAAKGNIAKYNELLMQAAAAQDAIHGPNKPPIDVKNGPGARPSVA